MHRTMLVLSIALLVALCLAIMPAATALGARDAAPSQFPCGLRLQPGDHFFLFGEELRDSLAFEHVQGVLLVNGRRLAPPPAPAPGSERRGPSDSLYLATYGGVPIFRDCLARGLSCSDCARRLDARRDSMATRIADRWRELRAAEGGDAKEPPRERVEAWSDSALLLLDSTLVGPLEAARERASISGGGLLRFVIPGARSPEVLIQLSLTDAPLPPMMGDSITAADALARVRAFATTLQNPKPSLVIVSRGGEVRVNGPRVSAFLAEIEAIRSDPGFTSRLLSGGQSDEFRRFASR